MFGTYLLSNQHLHSLIRIQIWAPLLENLILLHSNNKTKDHPALPSSLISTFFIGSLERTIAVLAAYQISIVYLVFLAEQAVLA